MIKVGVTGGIGSGKTFVCSLFKELGIPIFNSDEVARRNYFKKEIQDKIKNQLEIEYSMLDADGTVNRKKLANLVFNNKEQLEILNSIVHPDTGAEFDNWLKDKSEFKYIIKEAAILFESGANKKVDVVITVVAPLEVRIKRLIQRDGSTREEILKKMDCQWTDGEKIDNSHFVITNNLEDVKSQVLEIHKKLIAMENEIVIPTSNKYQAVAEDTVKKVEEGLYKKLVDKSVDKTQYFVEYMSSYVPKRDFSIESEEDNYKLNVYAETSLEAIYRIHKEGKSNIGVLNFASAKKPGGGFLRGRIAQEETLARSSSLYHSLLKYPQYYENPKAPYYSNKIIYSPDVVFFKNDYGDMIPEPVLASVVTCAAPNLTDAENVDHNKVRQIFLIRIFSVLSLFEHKGCRNIILGAWGCGVFKNDPNLVRAYFKHVIKNCFEDKFETINFSIYDPSGVIVEIFKK